MATNNLPFRIKQNLPTQPIIKYVTKASQWVTTTFNENGKQIQTWSTEKPNEN